MQIIFLSGTKCLWLPQYVNKFLVWHKKIGPAHNILGPVKGQGISYILFGTSITFQIIAKDMNGSAGYLSSDALIELTIIDVNDETPTVNTMNTGSVSCVKSQF